MFLIALVTITTLIIAGLFHFYWAFGGKVGLNRAIPTKDGKPLLNPGKFLTLLVGLTILGFALISYILNFESSYSVTYFSKIVYAGWFLSGIFMIRSIGDFHSVGLFKKITSTKFAEFDSKYFVPLTLFWSISFALTSYQV